MSADKCLISGRKKTKKKQKQKHVHGYEPWPFFCTIHQIIKTWRLSTYSIYSMNTFINCSFARILHVIDMMFKLKCIILFSILTTLTLLKC
jgi:hypothetical protein